MLGIRKDKKNILGLGFVIFLAFLLRAAYLTALPIFTDEAIYVRWIQIASNDPAWRFISLTDGKQPLFVWLGIISWRFFSDPLFAGRFISVIAGMITPLGIFFLGKELFGRKTGLFAALIWAIFPFAVWHDRLAMMDALLAAFTAWGLWLSVLLVKKRQTDIALILGIVIGGGLLTKSSAQFLIYLLPFSLILIKIKPEIKLLLSNKFLKWLGLALLVAVMAVFISWVQRLSPFYYIVGLKNLTFIYSFEEVIDFGVREGVLRLWWNLRGLSGWLFAYLTSLIIPIFVSLAAWKNKLREKIYLLVCFFFPFLALAFFGKVLYPRFMLFMTVPLVVLMANGFLELSKIIKNKLLLVISYLLLVIYPLYFDSQIVFNISNTPLPNVDRGQYLDDWPAGWGVLEVVDFLNKESLDKNIALGTEGTFGLTPYAFEIYLRDNSNVEIKGFWPISDGISWLAEKSREKQTFLVLKDTQKPDSEWPVELVAKFKRGKGDNYLGLYKVINK